MAPPAGQQNQQNQQDPPPDPAQGGTADARITAIEQTQRQQGQVLDRVLAAVTGGAAPAGQHAGAADAQQAPANIAEQVRREIADADQRRKAEEDERTWRAGVTEVVEKVKAEKAPREPETGVRATLRRIIIGKEE
jgi:hypothetical protein